METKTCFTCKQEKPISEFRKNKRNKDGLNGACRTCSSEYSRLYRLNHPDEYVIYDQHRREKSKKEKRHRKYQTQEKYINYRRELRQTPENKEYHRKYTTAQKYRDYKNQYRIDNYDLVRGREREREKEYNKRPEVRIKRALRARLLGILKRGEGSKSGKMVELVGCTMPFLREHLESLWKEGMSWDNYGFGRGHWVMDHIIPCERFVLTIPEEQKKCFHYSNIQPLWWEENAAKSDK